ncbi:hypothetical protein J5U23_02130 [Saccharolobus shibatae B12]|uniref:Uncharacterized protein n=2 Tax=Saccharolobus shibatae TaxID=2286 RepID=A0A8F5BQ54_SACSH|nr:hypothetical protein J5U23_02130 [Saccharolobus shibatae B12]QXJ35644.1 hypothetical protein J5U22_02191 [Saccharolobus shibatae]
MNTFFKLYLVIVIMSFILFFKRFNLILEIIFLLSYKIIFSNLIITVKLRYVLYI